MNILFGAFSRSFDCSKLAIHAKQWFHFVGKSLQFVGKSLQWRSHHLRASWLGLMGLLVILGQCPLWLGPTQLWAIETVRFATFNVSLYGKQADAVASRLARSDDPQAAAVAEIIQRVRPDVLLLNEFDYDPEGHNIDLFQQNYLQREQNVSQSPTGPAEPIDYPYRFSATVNTGIHSGFDLDRNGKVDSQPGSNHYAGDCWGYGRYPGQYGMVLLSRFPIVQSEVRTFRKLLWKEVADAQLPDDESTTMPHDWYTDEMLAHFPLSSKSHWDIPVKIHGRTIHAFASHPTPPVFDGPEDRNGRRNHDEIRFWADYIDSPSRAGYIRDDRGVRGGLTEGKFFVILGDLNGDPHDGQGRQGIGRLLSSAKIISTRVPESEGGAQQAVLQGGANSSQQGNPRHDTLDAKDQPGPGNLRLDYVLPSANLRVARMGVFWPESSDPTFRLVGTHPFPSSDHRLVWVDLTLENGKPAVKGAGQVR
ncbi:MAG: endonuclease/exonuclease/phosphatase family protein [Pirellulales bacterium]